MILILHTYVTRTSILLNPHPRSRRLKHCLSCFCKLYFYIIDNTYIYTLYIYIVNILKRVIFPRLLWYVAHLIGFHFLLVTWLLYKILLMFCFLKSFKLYYNIKYFFNIFQSDNLGGLLYLTWFLGTISREARKQARRNQSNSIINCHFLFFWIGFNF